MYGENAILGGETTGFLQPILALIITYAAVIALVRIAGLRSFAKLSAFDFAATIAVGSLIASAAIGSTPLFSGIAALVALFAAQMVVAKLRETSAFRSWIDNSPTLLMRDGALDHAAMKRADMIEADLAAQLRKAGVTDLARVDAVVLETSGDLSVIASGKGFDALPDLVRRDLG